MLICVQLSWIMPPDMTGRSEMPEMPVEFNTSMSSSSVASTEDGDKSGAPVLVPCAVEDLQVGVHLCRLGCS